MTDKDKLFLKDILKPIRRAMPLPEPWEGEL